MIGYAFCGSFCTFSESFEVLKKLRELNEESKYVVCNEKGGLVRRSTVSHTLKNVFKTVLDKDVLEKTINEEKFSKVAMDFTKVNFIYSSGIGLILSRYQQLKEKKIRVGMLTGDNENVAKAIAEEVGIEDYYAEALPDDKAKAVQRIRAVGGFVAMVGDGINDSPALKEADIGIAMGNGTDIAIDTADVVLSRGDLRLVNTAIELSQKTVRNIKENLFWAFFYNCIAIPLAAGVFAFAHISLKPWMGAVAMCMSSLFVVTNALRLMQFGKKKENVEKESNNMQKTLKIEGMMCQHCVAHVTKALQGINGVTNVEVNLKKKTAVVEFSEDVSNETLTAAIVDAGYEVKKIS